MLRRHIRGAALAGLVCAGVILGGAAGATPAQATVPAGHIATVRTPTAVGAHWGQDCWDVPPWARWSCDRDRDWDDDGDSGWYSWY